MLNYLKDTFDGIIPLSGGIDSTAALYKTLTENPDQKFIVFWVKLANGISGNRILQEERAVEGIVDWCQQQGLENFAFRKLDFNYTSLGPMPPVWDSEIINFIAAVVLGIHPEVHRFIDGAIKDDFTDPSFQGRLDKIAKILYLHTGKSAESLKIELPLKDMAKYEVMTSMPSDLLSLTWSCRFPESGGPYHFVRCHKCPQCSVIDNVLESHPQEFKELDNI